MCDIYLAKCKECYIKTDMHLENFATGRDEVEVFCQKHIPQKDVYIFETIERKGRYGIFKKGTKIGVRSLTENARKHAKGNCPNTGQVMKIISIDRLGRKRKIKK